MKKNFFIATFVGTQLLFTFLIIYKNSHIINQTYHKQHQERKKEELLRKKQQLTELLYRTKKNHRDIKAFATAQLKMTDVKLSQIKKLPV